MSASPLDIVRVGDDRVRIRGPAPDSDTASHLLRWLGARPEVLTVAYRPDGSALEVRYRERGLRGAFMRSLEDFVFTIDRAPPVPFAVAVRSALPGRVRLALDGTSDDDVMRLSAWLATQPGVVRTNPSPASSSVLVLFDPSVTTAERLLSLAHTSSPASWPAAPKTQSPHWAPVVFNTAMFAASATGLVPLPVISAGVALTAFPTVRRAATALRARRITVDLLDVAAIATSIATGQPATAAFITWLLGIGDLLLEHSADRARVAISRLMKLEATEAWRVTETGTERVPADRLSVDDVIVIDAGQRVAADGTVVSGIASVDEKALTGESELRERRAGDRILAATVVAEGQIVVRVERIGVDTTAAKIVKILEGAGAKPMTLQREVEHIADRLVLPTFGVAAGAAILSGEIARATSVLITDFGTGIRVSVPTSALASMAVAARHGVLVKGAQYLERLARADVVVFDKTGTLTTGAPGIVDVTVTGDLTAREVVAFAAGAEARQSHPIAEAIRRHAESLGLEVPEAELGSESYAIGLGLAARVRGRAVLVGGRRWMQRHGLDPAIAHDALEAHARTHASSLLVAVDGRIVGALGYSDTLRPESPTVVRALQAGGRRRVVLLSGDANGPVSAVARAVGADDAVGEMLPEDKADYVRRAQREGKVVAMVGDGINDAPALALADVGISLHGGTDVALETADVVLLEGGLHKLAFAFETGDRTMRHVRRALGIVVAPNAIAIVLGAVGLLNPALAAAVNNGSTVLAALAALSPVLFDREPESARAGGKNERER